MPVNLAENIVVFFNPSRLVPRLQHHRFFRPLEIPSKKSSQFRSILFINKLAVVEDTQIYTRMEEKKQYCLDGIIRVP